MTDQHEPLSAEEMARKAAELAGGTWGAPREEYHLIGPDEIVVETPLARPDSREVMFLHPGDMSSIMRMNFAVDKIDPSARVRTVTCERREYRANVWVPDHENYDAAANVLNLYGHWRTHRFYVWVPEGSASHE